MSLPPAARKMRVMKEIKALEARPPWGITCFPEKEDAYDSLRVCMLGPRSTPYSKGMFKLLVTIPDRYPFEPPLVKFLTPVYHPNIDKGGRICMDLLKMPPKGSWVPTVTMETLLVAIQTLLANPNPDDPLMMDIANEFKNDREMFTENATKYTEKHATNSKKAELTGMEE